MTARWPAPARRVLAAVLRSLGMLLAVALAGLAGWLDRVSPPSGCHHQMVPAGVPAPSLLAAVSEAPGEPGGLFPPLSPRAPAPVAPRAEQGAMAVTPADGVAVLPPPSCPPGPGQHPHDGWPPVYAVRRHGDGVVTVGPDGALGLGTLIAPVMLRDTGALMACEVMEPEYVPPPLTRAPWMALGPGGHCVAVSPAEFMRERDGVMA